MKLSNILFSILLPVGVRGMVNGLPGSEYRAPEGHDFIPAGRNDSRSPCPWLNALANHGYLPRNGRNITRKLVEEGFSKTFNFVPGTLEGPTAGAITTGKRGNGTFDLEDTVKHNVVEHDGSMSRNDEAIGNSLVFDPVIWNRTRSHFKSDTISLRDIAVARLDRFATAKTLNPQFDMSGDSLANTFVNHAVWQLSFGDRVEGNANTLFTRVIFGKVVLEEERLPFKEGFVRPCQPITGSDIANMVGKIQKAAVEVGMSSIPNLAYCS
ncbi:putative chloroperoxidase [Metarhizium anisopliae]